MNIPWKYKSLLYSLIDRFNLTFLLYFCQKYITKRSIVKINEIPYFWKLHRNEIQNLGLPRIFEFGGGKNLAQNIYLSDLCKEQIVVDLNRMADIDQINDGVRQLCALFENIKYRKSRTFEELYENFNIKYIAPLDASRTGFPDDYFDCCISTNTLEHIPSKSIINIFNELRRIIKPNGLVCAQIDYSDHYSHTDTSISLLNYLKFNNREWIKYNHSCHYQNRLRHYDYRSIFLSLGFSILSEKSYFNEINPPKSLSSIFDDQNSEIFATTGYFVLRNN